MIRPFLIRFYSDVACELHALPPLLRGGPPQGRWEGMGAGGRWPLASWTNNPQYLLCSDVSCSAVLRLERCPQVGVAAGHGIEVADGREAGAATGTNGGANASGPSSGAGALRTADAAPIPDREFDPKSAVGFCLVDATLAAASCGALRALPEAGQPGRSPAVGVACSNFEVRYLVALCIRCSPRL